MFHCDRYFPKQRIFPGGWHLVDGRMVSVLTLNTVLKYGGAILVSDAFVFERQCLPTRVRRWCDGVCLGALASRNSN